MAGTRAEAGPGVAPREAANRAADDRAADDRAADDGPRTRVRRVEPGETDLVQAVGELVVAVYGGEGHVRGSYLDVLGNAAERVATADVLVALDADTERPVDGLLGTVTVAIAPNAFADMTEPGEAEMRMLAVAPRARRRGLGRVLAVACLERAAAAGAPTLRLASNATMTAAHALYASLGFVRTPDRDWSPQPGTTLMTFARPLDVPVEVTGRGPGAGASPDGDQGPLRGVA